MASWVLHGHPLRLQLLACLKLTAATTIHCSCCCLFAHFAPPFFTLWEPNMHLDGLLGWSRNCWHAWQAQCLPALIALNACPPLPHLPACSCI